MKIVLGEGPFDYINDSVCKTEKCFLGIHNVNPS